LTAGGFQVLEAGNGVEAARQIEASAVDLMIADVGAPMEKIQERQPRLKVIALSKPIQPDELMQTVSRVMLEEQV
jgi:DNA-binding response OmpR family regulator